MINTDMLQEEEQASFKERLLSMFLHWRPWLLVGLVVLIAGLSYEALQGLLAELSYEALVNEVRTTSTQSLLLAILATAVSYVALTGYDYSSLRYVNASVPYRLSAQTSFIAYAVSNTIGLGVLTGGTVRMRLYGAAGVEIGKISRAIAFNAAGFGLGIHTVGAAALLWRADAIAPVAHLPVWVIQGVATLILAATAGLLVLCRDGRERSIFGIFTLRLPSALIVMQQLLFSVVDIAASAAVLWLLLPAGSIDFTAFLGFYAIATVLGILSHLPGGIGVFEAVMLVALGGRLPIEALAGALVLYRVIYYLLPLMLALVLLLAHEVRRGTVAPVTRAISGLAPLLLTALTLVTGVMLIVSGVTPATNEASELLALYVPLPLVEASHFIGSIIGLALLFVARGMLLRLDAAWWAGLLLTLLSVILAFSKGIAIAEATVLSFLAIALALSRKEFTRKASLFAQPFTGGWLLAVSGILAAVIGLLFFVYREVEYVHDLWWQFEFDGHASRALRSIVGLSLVTFMLALQQMLRPAVRVTKPDPAAMAQAAAIISRQDSADANLALMGDKSFLFSESGDAFIMFGRHGRSWISLFDPVGPQSEWPELIWLFIENAREGGGRASFYHVRPQALPLYLDAGLRLYKIGEEAYVPLPDFSLKGKKRANLRHAVNRAARDGLTFETVPVENVPAILDEIRFISDSWLAEHRTSEKGFSLGAFDPAYIVRQPVALVRKGTRAVAFATLMSTQNRIEASVDLMRHLPDAPPGTMDFLFASLMLHFREEGYQRFGLGMAPLSGMTGHALAPVWHRMGRLLFAHGEYFYNFKGLRAFKEKLDPQWEPRYLASPGIVAPLLVLFDITTLISGSFKKVITK